MIAVLEGKAQVSTVSMNSDNSGAAGRHAGIQFNRGDRVQLKKAHPCGADEWIVYRVGADIGLRCVGCERHVMLARSEFLKRLKRVVSSATPEHYQQGDDR